MKKSHEQSVSKMNDELKCFITNLISKNGKTMTPEGKKMKSLQISTEGLR